MYIYRIVSVWYIIVYVAVVYVLHNYTLHITHHKLQIVLAAKVRQKTVPTNFSAPTDPKIPTKRDYPIPATLYEIPECNTHNAHSPFVYVNKFSYLCSEKHH